MSQQNVEMVRALYATWERGDFGSVEWAHPEIEYVIADGPEPRTTTGLAGMAETHRAFLSAWEDWRVEAEECLELDDDRVLVPFHFNARGKESGLEVGQVWTKGATVFHLRAGKVARIVQYLDRDHAPDATELSE